VSVDAMQHPAFTPAWWLPGPHLQTLWQPLFRWWPQPETRRERLDTPDGDFLDLDWFGPATEPIVILLHGLSGSSRSPYIRGMQAALAGRGWRSVTLNFRGCGGEPNRTARGYHSGDTRDLDHVHQTLRQRHPDTPLAAVGYSLGGNVLLKWLGEHGPSAELFAAAAVSVPLRLELCADRMDHGWSRLYRNRLLRELKQYITRKQQSLESQGATSEAQRLVRLGELAPIRSFREYDNQVVARLYGFRDADDYYRQASAGQYLWKIQRPTLLIQALDDPFLTSAVLPEPHELSPCVQLEVTDGGGHVGFVGGRLPLRPDYWLERRITGFLADNLAESVICGKMSVRKASP
jgi:predicted alpha/beta-fold hydrolase